MLEEDHVEIYISYLLTIEKWDEAAVRLAKVHNTPTQQEPVMTVSPQKAVGRLNALWIKFANFYESFGDLANARIIFEKATEVSYKAVDDLASIWCEYGPRPALSQPRADGNAANATHQKDASLGYQNGIWDIRRYGIVPALYEAKAVSTPQMIINFAHLLEEHQYFEESFKAYEKGVAAFKWPHVKDLWL
eukprot:gene156-20_t